MSIVLTRMQNYRATSNLDKWETRPSMYGGLSVFMKQTDDPNGIITQDLETKASSSIGSTLETPVYDYNGSITIGNTRSVTIADSENTTRMITISFATYSWGFTIVPTNFHNNEIDMQRDFNQKMKMYENKFNETIDAVAIAALESNKTQVVADTLGLYTFASNTVSALYSQREEVIGDIDPVMAANDFWGQRDVVGNFSVQSLIKKMAEDGIYNAVNKQIQFNDKTWHFSNRVTNATDRYATMFAVQEGSVGILKRFEREALRRGRSRTGHEWDITTLPMTGLPVGTYYYESVGDQSALAGTASADNTRAIKQHYGFSVDLAFVVAYTSDDENRATPILKWDIKTEGTA